MPEFRAYPMPHRAVFRWIFATSGLWLMPLYLGLVLGLGLFIAPWLADFVEVFATWNAAVVGAILSAVAFFKFLHEQSIPASP